MTVSGLGEKLSLVKLSDGGDKEIASCYISDLLSRVMGGAKSGDVWITVQSSINVVAVALLTEVSCVILPEGVTAPEAVISKANEEGLTIFSFGESAFSLAVKIASLI